MPDNSKLISMGRYAIYETADGEGVVAYRPDGQETDNHQVVPAKFWSLVLKMISGEIKNMSPLSMMKVLTGR